MRDSSPQIQGLCSPFIPGERSLRGDAAVWEEDEKLCNCAQADWRQGLLQFSLELVPHDLRDTGWEKRPGLHHILDGRIVTSNLMLNLIHCIYISAANMYILFLVMLYYV